MIQAVDCGDNNIKKVKQKFKSVASSSFKALKSIYIKVSIAQNNTHTVSLYTPTAGHSPPLGCNSLTDRKRIRNFTVPRNAEVNFKLNFTQNSKKFRGASPVFNPRTTALESRDQTFSLPRLFIRIEQYIPTIWEMSSWVSCCLNICCFIYFVAILFGFRVPKDECFKYTIRHLLKLKMRFHYLALGLK